MRLIKLTRECGGTIFINPEAIAVICTQKTGILPDQVREVTEVAGTEWKAHVKESPELVASIASDFANYLSAKGLEGYAHPPPAP